MRSLEQVFNSAVLILTSLWVFKSASHVGKLLCKNQGTNSSYCSNFGPQVTHPLTLYSNFHQPRSRSRCRDGDGELFISVSLQWPVSCTERSTVKGTQPRISRTLQCWIWYIYEHSLHAPPPIQPGTPPTGYTPNIHCTFLPLDFAYVFLISERITLSWRWEDRGQAWERASQAIWILF